MTRYNPRHLIVDGIIASVFIAGLLALCGGVMLGFAVLLGGFG